MKILKEYGLDDHVMSVKCSFGIKQYKRLDYSAKCLLCLYILLMFIWVLIYPGKFLFTAYRYDIEQHVFNYITYLPIVVFPFYRAIIKSFVSYPMNVIKYIGFLIFTAIFTGWLYPLLWYRIAVMSNLSFVASIMILIVSIINLCYLSMIFKDNVVFYLSLTPYEVAQLLNERQTNV